MKKYEIVLEGHINSKRFCGFEQLDIRHLKDGTTSVTGIIDGQAMFYALLGRTRDLGMKLKSVKIIEEYVQEE